MSLTMSIIALLIAFGGIDTPVETPDVRRGFFRKRFTERSPLSPVADQLDRVRIRHWESKIARVQMAHDCLQANIPGSAGHLYSSPTPFEYAAHLWCDRSNRQMVLMLNLLARVVGDQDQDLFGLLS